MRDPRPTDSGPAGGSRAGVVWLLSDLTLVTLMSVLVKRMGLDYSAAQMVALRAVIGLVLIAPLVWRHRFAILAMRDPRRNALRVLCNAVALNANFHVLTALPLATANAIGYLRPIVTMFLAMALLGERVDRRRWTGAAVIVLGVIIAVGPQIAGIAGLPAPVDGLIAAAVMLVFGSLAVVQTRALKDENPVVMMLFYTLGVGALTALPAALVWTPVKPADWPALIAIGVLAQAGQFCFLRAYALSEAAVLAPVSYASIIFATAAGWIFFAETPTPWHVAGAGLILAALILSGWRIGMRRPGA